MLTVHLLFISVSVVAANPVYQRIPIQLTQTCPSQTCPTQTVISQPCPTQTCLPQINPSQTCQTCLPKTCPTCQPTFSALPNQIRQTPCQSCQNNQRNILPLSIVARQPNCPCNQQGQNINQPNQEILNQMVLSQILGPQLQNILNANPKTCDRSPKPKPEVVPNIINNYIIIPPEYFKTNDTKSKHEVNRTRERKSRRRSQKPMNNDEDFELDDTDKILSYGQKLEEINDSARNNVRSGKHGSQINEECDNGIGPYPNPKSNDASTSKFTNDEKSHLLFEKIGKFLGNTVFPHNPNKSPDTFSDKVFIIENKPVEVIQSNPEKVKTFEETIIKDFCKNNPSIPEHIAWSLLMNLKKQVQNTEYPMFHSNNQAKSRTITNRRKTDRRQRRPKQSRSGRRNKNTEKNMIANNEPCDTCDKLVELNPTVVNVKTETSTTEKILTTTAKTVKETIPQMRLETQTQNPKNLIDKLEQIKDKFVKLNEIETTTMNYNKLVETFPELGKEDIVLTIDDNGVDYYPDFRGDNIAYIGSDERLEKYHYTTDRNGVAGERYVGSKKNSHDQFKTVNKNYKVDDINTEYTITVPSHDSDENSEESTYDSVEIQFRTPPSLEQPDFETKQINTFYASEETDDEFVTDKNKASAYSGRKRSQENDLQPVKVFSKDRKGKTSVETVFGHSKVVKYGQDVKEAGSSPVITYYLPEEAITEERIQLPDGEKAVVVAKSIRNLKEIWE